MSKKTTWEKRTTWDIDLKNPHPCIRVQLTNKPVWKTGHDGTSAHALVPHQVLASIHGPDCHKALRSRWDKIPEERRATHPILGLAPDGKVSYKDYETSVVLQFGEDDVLDNEEALAHTQEPTDEEIAKLASTVELPGDFDEMFKDATGRPPTDDDREESKKMTAKSHILNTGERLLLGLPERATNAIRENRVDVVVIREKCRRGFTRRGKRTVSLANLLALREQSWVTMPRHWDNDPERFLVLTSRLEEDGSYCGIAFVEMPTVNRDGLIVVFPPDLVDAVLVERNWYLAVFGEAWFERHPPMRYKAPGNRRRGHGRGKRQDATAPEASHSAEDDEEIDDDESSEAEPSSAQLPA